MPSKIRPRDWERLFAPNAPRRGGPLQVLATVVMVAVAVIVVGVGIQFLLNYREQQNSTASARATTMAATLYPQATQTIVARTATAEARSAAALTAVAQETGVPQATPVAGLGTSTVVRGGNLRTSPEVTDTNVVGLLWEGDSVAVLESRDAGGQLWYRVQVLAPAANRGGEGVPAGQEGWASSLLIAPPQQ